MNSIEEDLKQALRRREPPAEFAGKVIGLVNSGERPGREESRGPSKVLVFPLKPKLVVWLATAAAAACLAALFVTRFYVADRGSLEAPGRVSASNELPHAATPQPIGGQVAAAAQVLEGNGNGSGPHQARNRGPRPTIHRSRTGSYQGNAGKEVPEEARHAEEQLRIALAITSAKLGYAQRSIQEADGTSIVDREVNR
jgi:hypothetical protein